MALIGFINTRNQPVYVNPEHVAYVAIFEPAVSIIALAITGANGKPVEHYVRGDIDQVQAKLVISPTRKAGESAA